jgi:hypothetical protein
VGIVPVAGLLAGSYMLSSAPSVPPEPLRFESVRFWPRFTVLLESTRSGVPEPAVVAAFPKLTATMPLAGR